MLRLGKFEGVCTPYGLTGMFSANEYGLTGRISYNGKRFSLTVIIRDPALGSGGALTFPLEKVRVRQKNICPF